MNFTYQGQKYKTKYDIQSSVKQEYIDLIIESIKFFEYAGLKKSTIQKAIYDIEETFKFTIIRAKDIFVKPIENIISYFDK